VIPTNDFLPYLSVLSAVLTISFVIGGFSFKNGRQEKLAKFQKDTNDALEQRIKALEGRSADLEKENIIQRHIIETITLALKQKGLIITIDGDMVTITDQNTNSSSHRKRMIHTQPPGALPKKEEP
jgi:hypothetical protein